MSEQWDEFSKSLSDETIPRRESVRLLGAALAGALLSPLGAGTAWARRGSDPCEAFCQKCPKSRRSQCLAACAACDQNTSRLCGTCGAYACCDWPGPNENGACVNGRCEYWCEDGATYCDGRCTFLDWDAGNCGACGNECGGDTPYCSEGQCSDCPGWICDGRCVDLLNDPDNCGACGFACGVDEDCRSGVCQTICIPNCSGHYCGPDGCGGYCRCPSGMYCEPYSNWCAISEPTDF
jgi:hypothetical protein